MRAGSDSLASKRWRLTISYGGGAYAGWQRQTNALAVQQVVEEALGALFAGDLGPDLDSEPVTIVGAGRTDAGVHARGQVAHLDPPRPLPATALVHGTNHHLPADVRILAASPVPTDFHARKSATGKRYAYRFVEGRVASPLDTRFAATLPRPLDLDAVRRALAALPGRHDFSAFALAGGAHTSPVRRLFAATVDREPPAVRDAPSKLVFRFWGEGFLRGMVRALVGTLVEIGRGDRAPEDMARLLEPGRAREEAGATAEARGLCLERVFYS